MQKDRRSFILPLLLAMLAAGCVGGGLPGLTRAPAPPPPWVLQPPADTDQAYYGVGEGADLESARAAALRDIAGRFRISVAATRESRMTVANDTVDRLTRARVTEDIRKTTFGQHVVEQTTPSERGHYALVRVDRAAFVAETRRRLDAEAATLGEAVRSAEGRGAAERFRRLHGQAARLDDVADLVNLVTLADPNGPPPREHERTLAAARGALQQAREQFRIVIRHHDTDADVARALQSFLTAQGVTAGGGRGPRPAELRLHVGSHAETVYGTAFVRLKIAARTYGDGGTAIAEAEHAAAGSSVNGIPAARRAAVELFAEHLQRMSLVEVLGWVEPRATLEKSR